MSRIRRNEIPNVTLSRTDYDNYRQKFSGSLQQGVSFSNQLNLHEQLRIIKDENHFTNEFFTAAKIYTKRNYNNEVHCYNFLFWVSPNNYNPDHSACQITIEVDSDSSLSDSDSEPYTTDEHILQQSSSLNDDEQLINSNDDEQLINNKVLKVQTQDYNLWKNAKLFETENNALKIENYADSKKQSKTSKTQSKTLKQNSEIEIKFKAERKELVTELNLLKNKNEEAENRKKQLENKINKIIED
ncbi:10634_t:CDS:2, partial [Racocetra fulgida]